MVVSPATSYRSLIDTGRPASGPSCTPALRAASACRAAAQRSVGVQAREHMLRGGQGGGFEHLLDQRFMRQRAACDAFAQGGDGEGVVRHRHATTGRASTA
jgi:hypothetical protein